jgi:hypothetical protein
MIIDVSLVPTGNKYLIEDHDQGHLYTNPETDMSRSGIELGPPAREASTLEKSHLDSLFAGYSEPLLELRWRSARGLYNLMYFGCLMSFSKQMVNPFLPINLEHLSYLSNVIRIRFR